MRHVVLLRGINVGGRNKVPMAELRAALEQNGFAEVRSVLQSGNLTLDGAGDDIAERVRRIVGERFGVDSEILVRTAGEWRALLAGDPFADVRTDGSRHFVILLDGPLAADRLPRAVAPERLAVRPRELHAWCPNGLRESPLMAAFARLRPPPATTVRNWNTVERLGALLA